MENKLLKIKNPTLSKVVFVILDRVQNYLDNLLIKFDSVVEDALLPY